ncbi:BRCA1-associated RING domain protein 1-like [Ptychodera flava]|uniref:BRCA1-associated RING domain protein 1-like n=1 Tax=Ptychodera flava TaxID=63121 RepID=UPI00396A0821
MFDLKSGVIMLWTVGALELLFLLLKTGTGVIFEGSGKNIHRRGENERTLSCSFEVRIREDTPVGDVIFAFPHDQHYASRNGHRDTCKLLLDKGADPNIQTKSGVTPLHRAAYCQHANIVRLLLSHQADPTLTDDDGKSPLHKAAEKGNLEICQMLISVSPTVGEAMKDIQDYRDKMALDYVPDDNTGLKKLLRPVLRDSDVERHSCGEDDDDEDEEERQRFRKELEESFGLRDDTDDDL